jgi:hypothetical protein
LDEKFPKALLSVKMRFSAQQLTPDAVYLVLRFSSNPLLGLQVEETGALALGVAGNAGSEGGQHPWN